MNVKRSVVALATTGGAAALVFGGSAVATDFTTAHSGSVKARTATVADSVQGFDIARDNAIPGESVTQKASYKNDGRWPSCSRSRPRRRRAPMPVP
ncbi:MAG TPA: hypothetical protein VKP64_03140 [Mycobacteriales bacterium]|nr:hypothetical protein [Mycobacteriales bacterium]